MWGFELVEAAKLTLDLFQKNGLKEILIPGFEYGRNAKNFSVPVKRHGGGAG
ncbi:hypothetical protein BH24BAC1_BH24BAC1_26760 [soil metagenome]